MLKLRVKDFKFKKKKHLKLSHFNPDETYGYTAEIEKDKTKGLLNELSHLQELLYAEHKNKVVVVLQGMDTSGKDGTIKHVFRGLNPEWVRVKSFKKPSVEELDHDYLWRIHKETPALGEIVIFNRSHYEDVLVTRVHGLIKDKEAKKRFRQIRDFERFLVEEGVLVLKFFLHISKDEQKNRLESRIEIARKKWKLSEADIHERKYWSEYQEAYSEALNATNTSYAPWYIIPSNMKWFKNLAISHILVNKLRDLKMKYPSPTIESVKIR